MDTALGLIEVEGVAGIIAAGDAVVKTVPVTLLGWESIGGYTTLFFCGSLSNVTEALRRGEQAARELVGHVVTASLARPEAVCRNYIAFPLDSLANVRPGALGLLETRGYGIHVQVNDRMVKTAAVEVVNVLTVHNRVVCTLIQGEVEAVREAVAVGRTLLADYAHFLCSAVIPQPVPEVLQAFGTNPRTGGGGV
jgi:microcompartment protein CcmL/EutN